MTLQRGVLPSLLLSAGLAGPLVAASVGLDSGHGERHGRTSYDLFHTRLEASTPAEGDVLTSPLPVARFEFSGPVEPSLTRLLLRYPSGDSLFLGTIVVPDSAHVIRAEFPDLAPGLYALAWTTVSVDGHAADGVIGFEVAADAESRAPAAETADDSTGVAETAAGDGLGIAEPASLEVAGPPLRRTLFRGLGLACLLAAAGVLWFAGGSGLVREPAVLRAASAAALLATILLGLDYLDWLGDVRPAGMGVIEGLVAAVRTRTGMIEGSRVLLAGLTFFLAGGARAGRMAGLVAMVAVIFGAASGHPAVIEPSLALPANALHLGAAAIWIGGVLLLTVLPDHPEKADGGWRYEQVASRVSSRAFLAVGVILGTALLQDLLFLGGIGNLLTTRYGQLLIAKSVGLVLLIGFGAWHRWKTLPKLVQTGDQGPLRLAVRIEILFLTGVILLAAWLALTPPPVAG
ncbi:MAG: copper resistance protein CopC/CopD [Gemmatimonadetes bacterium]|nr:copper resistance protein CopC/CopD [Gemmatimonadota bacterium]